MIYREYRGVSINKWENKYHFKLDDYHHYEYHYYLMDNPIYSN